MHAARWRRPLLVREPTPVALPTGMQPRRLAIGLNLSCAIVGADGAAMGDLWCWGENGGGLIDSTDNDDVIATRSRSVCRRSAVASTTRAAACRATVASTAGAATRVAGSATASARRSRFPSRSQRRWEAHGHTSTRHAGTPADSSPRASSIAGAPTTTHRSPVTSRAARASRASPIRSATSTSRASHRRRSRRPTRSTAATTSPARGSAR